MHGVGTFKRSVRRPVRGTFHTQPHTPRDFKSDAMSRVGRLRCTVVSLLSIMLLDFFIHTFIL